jgi:hypothetical protein
MEAHSATVSERNPTWPDDPFRPVSNPFYYLRGYGLPSEGIVAFVAMSALRALFGIVTGVTNYRQAKFQQAYRKLTVNRRGRVQGSNA